jgi:hypothetical protein
MRPAKTRTPATETRAAMMGLTPDEMRRYDRYHSSNQFGR